jgi:AcrR family transcriptional regulator
LTPVDSTRGRLVEAAKGLTEEGGYASATVAAIAERAGVSAGALYRHFPSKAELFVQVFREAGDEVLAEMETAATGPGDFIDHLEAVIETYARRAFENPRFVWALVYEPVDPLVDAERLVYRRDYCSRLATALRAGVEAGEIPEQDADLTAAALVGAIAESLVGPLSPLADPSPSTDHVLASLLAFARGAILAPGRGRWKAAEPR